MRPLDYHAGVLKLLDQTKLPNEYKVLELTTYQSVADAIKNMIVRGAPAIGVTAAYGVVIGALSINANTKDEFFSEFEKICEVLKSARPTAINLFWAVDRISRKAYSLKESSILEIKDQIEKEAQIMDCEDVETNKLIGKHGNELIKEKATILTHCNAGALATCDYGTALSVVRTAHEEGKKIQVFADETRPYLQGARLTAWELQQDGIDVTLICDNMAGHFMKLGAIDYVIVGADRIALNGDTANKIGTYSVAVLAKENNIPFYVAAPISTIDFSTPTGEGIPIEQRSEEEITFFNGKRIAPEGIRVLNPAFDVTPNRYISGIITEKGILRAPFHESISKVKIQ